MGAAVLCRIVREGLSMKENCEKSFEERPNKPLSPPKKPVDARGKEGRDVTLCTCRQQTMGCFLCQHTTVAMFTKPSVLMLFSLPPWGEVKIVAKLCSALFA